MIVRHYIYIYVYSIWFYQVILQSRIPKRTPAPVAGAKPLTSAATLVRWFVARPCQTGQHLVKVHSPFEMNNSVYISTYGDGSKPWYLVNPKIAGKWMFIPLKMVLIGIDPSRYNIWSKWILGMIILKKSLVMPLYMICNGAKGVKYHGRTISYLQ